MQAGPGEALTASFTALPSGHYAEPEPDAGGGVALYAASLDYDVFGNAVYGTGLAMDVPAGHVAMLLPLEDLPSRDLLMSPSPALVFPGDRREIKAVFKPSPVFCRTMRRRGEAEKDYDFVSIPARQDFSPENKRYPVPDDCAFDARVYKVGDKVCRVVMLALPNVKIAFSNLNSN